MANASNASNKVLTILKGPEDWEPWIQQLHSNVTDDFWIFVDPDAEEDPPAFIPKPQLPLPKDIIPGAQTYTQLSQVNQRTFKNARRFYSEELKAYTLQSEAIRTARSFINNTMSEAKALLLDHTKTLREWTKALKEDTKSPDNLLAAKVSQEYTTLLVKKEQRGHKWLDKWEGVIAKAIRYDIPKLKLGRWLKDFATQIRSIEPGFYNSLFDKSNDPELSKP